jgi:dolichol-phosphate mannosyltransferase
LDIPRNDDIAQLYQHRFDAASREAKQRLWRVLVRSFFQRYVRPDAAVLDIGCGFGEFLNNVNCRTKVGIDMNPEARGLLHSDVELHLRPAGDLHFLGADRFDVVFISNFLEHLLVKQEVEVLLRGVLRVLRPHGQCIVLGPNARHIPGAYWDFWDHHVPITDRSLNDVLGMIGFEVVQVIPRFLPYTTRSAMPASPWLVWLYLKMPWAWRILGQQFLVRAVRPSLDCPSKTE